MASRLVAMREAPRCAALKHLELIALEAEFGLGLVDGDFVMPAPAGGAVLTGGELKGGEHSFQGQVSEGVDFEEVFDLLDRAVVGDELFSCGEVDAIETGVTD